MNIGLIDVDGHGFPNLALMKISRYYKNQGCNVEWYNIFKHYDITEFKDYRPRKHEVCSMYLE